MKGMALQERERVRMLLSLVAHAVGYKMIVGAHNTVDAQRHVRVFYRVLHVGQMTAPTTLLMPRGLWGSLTVFAWYGN